MEEKYEPSLSIKMIDVNRPEALEDAFYIRREVFIKEQNVPEEEEIDELDLKAHHVIVYANARPVATGRLVQNGKSCLIGRICVLNECRGKQIGKLVVEKLLEKAAEIKAKEVHVHAQTHAVNFYEKLGFTPYGDTYLESNIKRVSMVKTL